jgi:hypothetical protein
MGGRLRLRAISTFEQVIAGLTKREVANAVCSIISEAITLEAGDVIVSGTPSGIGWARTPKLLMKAGDVCEVSVERIGTLRNVIADEAAH